MLLEYGANPYPPREGNYPICIAAEFGHEDTLNLLLNLKSSRLSRRNVQLQQALRVACLRNRRTTVMLLLGAGAGFNFDYETRKNLLNYAIEMEISTIRLLLQRGNSDGKMFACAEGHLFTAAQKDRDRIVNAFLMSTRNTSLRNSSGEMLLGMAAAAGHEEVVKVLLQYGANVNIRDSIDDSPLNLALANKHRSIVKLREQYSNNSRAGKLLIWITNQLLAFKIFFWNFLSFFDIRKWFKRSKGAYKSE